MLAVQLFQIGADFHRAIDVDYRQRSRFRGNDRHPSQLYCSARVKRKSGSLLVFTDFHNSFHPRLFQIRP